MGTYRGIDFYEIALLILVSTTFVLLLAIVLVLRRFFTLISPILEKFTGPGGLADGLKVPSLKQLGSIFFLKVMENLDFGKIAGNLGGMLGGGGPKPK